MCRLRCDEDSIGTVWPKPSGAFQVSKDVIRIDTKKINFKTTNLEHDYWKMAKERFIEMQTKKIPKRSLNKADGEVLNIEIVVETKDMC